ncbi:MAG: protein kinase domain-containing protein [Pyrinomonadaceae bacterium]
MATLIQKRHKAEAKAGDRLKLKAGLLVAGKKGKYEIKNSAQGTPFLGAGANGSVYQASNHKTGEPVAIKFLAPREKLSPKQSESLRNNFKNELKKLQELEHENIVRVLDWGDYDYRRQRIPFMILEYLPQDLRAMLKRDEVGWLMRFAYCIQMIDPLMCLSRQGWVHRDIKPENIMISDHDVVKLSDLGIAKLYANHEGRQIAFYPEDSRRPAPAAYMSPEQHQYSLGREVEIRPASDAFQLGRVFYEVFTGENLLGQINIDRHEESLPTRPMFKGLARLCSQHPEDRGGWDLVIDMLSIEFARYLTKLPKKLNSLTRETRLCLKYAFCERENGTITEFLHKRRMSWFCLWYWFWKMGMAPPYLNKWVLLGEIRIPRRGKIRFGSSKGAASLVDSMIRHGLLISISEDLDPLKTILVLTNLGKDIRDILCGSPRFEHLRLIGSEMKKRSILKLKVHWWDWLPEPVSLSKDKILSYEYCPCGSSKRYEECCDESK